MKKKYNIQLNPKRLSGKEVGKHRDFDALLNRYHHDKPVRSPLVRNLVMLGLALAASVAVLLFVFIGMNDETYGERDNAYFAALNYVNPPLPQVEKAFSSYAVNVSKGGVYNYKSGSKLTVPVAAFASLQGTPIEGEVTLHYREMHDFIDFFLSGIPMTYDSAGVQYTLESAGMIEIFAEQDGKRVNMAPGKSIDVELVSNVNVSPQLNVPPDYNIYQLDEEQRNWVYKEVDKMQVMDEDVVGGQFDATSPFFPIDKELREKIQSIQVNQRNEIARIEASLPIAKQPIKPEVANNNDYVFDLDFNDLKKPNATGELADAQQELAELYRQYEKMLWQLNPKSDISAEELQKGFSNVTGISIKKLNNRDYELKLEKEDNSLTVVVNPVLSGSDYNDAMAEFNRDFERWENEMKERNAKLQAAKNEALKLFEEEKRLANIVYDERIAELKAKGLDYAATEEILKRKVINRFQATGFGIWNCDRPLPPDMMILAANFEDASGNKFENKTAYLVDKSRNTVYQFLAEDGTRMRFNKNSDNLLWFVTSDNKIAVFRPEDFKGINKETNEHTFVMETVDKEINDESDVREVLYL